MGFRLTGVEGAEEVDPLQEERDKAIEADIQKAMGFEGLPPIQETPVEEELHKELVRLQKELLHFPKKDRFRFGGDFDMTYDNNPGRTRIRTEEGDTAFRVEPFVAVDLSGRKTDFGVEYRGRRNYRVKVSEGSDLLSMEGRVRFGRKITDKINLALNDRLSRESQRNQAVQDKKIRWDNSHQAALNYELTPKISANLEVQYSRRDFPHEEFDQDTDEQLVLDPNLFFQATPKTRFSAGYRWRFSHIETGSTNATTHGVRGGYSGRVTGKSSVSADLIYAHKRPDSADAAKANTLTWNAGYIRQATPKTSLRILYSSSWERSVTNSVSGEDLSKSVSRSISDTLSLSLRSRIHRRITTEFSFDGSHSRTKTDKDADPKTESRLFTFPFQVAVDYTLAQWMRLRFAYTYRHRLGDERKTDEHRAHTWFVATNVAL